MAFGRNKDEVFQRVTTVKEEPEKPIKKKKSKKEEVVAPAPDTTMWRSGSDADRPQRFDAPTAPITQTAPKTAETQSDTATGVREVGSAPKDNRPVIEMSGGIDEGEITGGMYSDSGRTVTMAMRLISYLLYVCGPLYFVGKIFNIMSIDADELTTGFVVSNIIDGIIGMVLLISAGILVVALIKILQNLMALQKKKKKR